MLKEILQRPISSSGTLIVIIILILLASNVFFMIRYRDTQLKLREKETALAARSHNEQVLNFTGLFIEKVLKSQGEIDFDTRLELEQAVRDLKDEEILGQWQKFTDSRSEGEAQEEVKNFLEILIQKTKFQ